MTSKAQIAANRRNAQQSTGPVTLDGKAAVRQNALRHGLCSAIPLMSDEDAGDVRQLLDAFIEENQPVGIHEEILVYKLAEHFFFQKRAACLLAEQLDWADREDGNDGRIGLMLRYHNSADRGFARTLNDLRKLQKERKLQEIGFVSQKTEEVSADPPSEPPAPTVVPNGDPVVAVQPNDTASLRP